MMAASSSYEDFKPDHSFRSTHHEVTMDSDTEDERDGPTRSGGLDEDGLQTVLAGSSNGFQTSSGSSKIYRSSSRSLKPEAIAARGLKEWARLVLTGGSCASSVAEKTMILYESPSRQPTIVGRQVHPSGHDPAQFIALTEPRVSRRHVLIWRELKDCNGDNMSLANYCLKIQSLGTSGTSYYVREPRKAEEQAPKRLVSALKGAEGKATKIAKDETVTLEYDMMAEIGVIIGHKLFNFQLILSPNAPLLPRGPPPMRVENLLDQLEDAMMMDS